MKNVMPLPKIVVYGQSFVEKYQTKKYMDELKQHFGSNQDGYIVLDDNPRGQEFLAACIAWAIEQKILYHHMSIEDNKSTISSFRLTNVGKEFMDDWS